MSGKTNEQIEKDLARFQEALDEPRTMKYLTHRFKVDRRTIYRWMDMLAESGIKVARIGLQRPTKYGLRG